MSKRIGNLCVVVIVENLFVANFKDFELSCAVVFEKEVKIMMLKTMRGSADGNKEPFNNIDINLALLSDVFGFAVFSSSLSTGGI